eukprot:UN00565
MDNVRFLKYDSSIQTRSKFGSQQHQNSTKTTNSTLIYPTTTLMYTFTQII